MDFRFYKALPDASVQWPSVSMDDEQEPDFVLIALERTNDPDANNHTGFDFFRRLWRWRCDRHLGCHPVCRRSRAG
jgi:hypothetical protein